MNKPKIMHKKILLLTALSLSGMLLVRCSEATPLVPVITDSDIQAQIATLLSSQPDLPTGLQVAVVSGRVTISGSLVCKDCAGQETPGSYGSVQQSVGAVARAVPGVAEVVFALTTQP